MLILYEMTSVGDLRWGQYNTLNEVMDFTYVMHIFDFYVIDLSGPFEVYRSGIGVTHSIVPDTWSELAWNKNWQKNGF